MKPLAVLGGAVCPPTPSNDQSTPHSDSADITTMASQMQKRSASFLPMPMSRAQVTEGTSLQQQTMDKVERYDGVSEHGLATEYVDVFLAYWS